MPLADLTALATATVPADLAGRAAHIARVADAIDAALDDLPAARAAATDLRAALGAIVAWSRGPRTDASTAELATLITALSRRAQATLLSTLADHWRVLADGGDERALVVSDLFVHVEAAITAGNDVKDATTDDRTTVRLRP